ncbi:tyrosine-protein phosphatase [Gordonia alkaliphila]|uniref:Tyrosine-protein phosphatase n=1 Tax=Gordonia alkaliphila TaxID=1053547 RepID=A0ABP8YY16_9ACTN|nr:tyrosine-protein phosphatase [Gordonia alkaliphila]MCK0440421.1 tyrosine-protein phosphatase [Gordonia alkaliphila]
MKPLPTVTTRRAATLAVTAALGLAPFLVDAAPANAVPQEQQQNQPQKQQAVPAPERVNLGGVYNARTFGSYTNTDGQALTDRVIRSGDLQNLNNAGLAELQRRDVTTIVDLRTSFERQLKPNRPVPGAKVVVADVMALAPLAGSADFPGMYRTFVDNPGAREAYRTMLLQVATTVERGDSVLIQCSAGRDRTGWGSAVLLKIAGADMKTIEADFTANNTGADVAWLRGAFAHVDRIYGGFDGYLRKGLRLSTAEIESIRTAMIASDATSEAAVTPQ